MSFPQWVYRLFFDDLTPSQLSTQGTFIAYNPLNYALWYRNQNTAVNIINWEQKKETSVIFPLICLHQHVREGESAWVRLCWSVHVWVRLCRSGREGVPTSVGACAKIDRKMTKTEKMISVLGVKLVKHGVSLNGQISRNLCSVITIRIGSSSQKYESLSFNLHSSYH